MAITIQMVATVTTILVMLFLLFKDDIDTTLFLSIILIGFMMMGVL